MVVFIPHTCQSDPWTGLWRWHRSCIRNPNSSTGERTNLSDSFAVINEVTRIPITSQRRPIDCTQIAPVERHIQNS